MQRITNCKEEGCGAQITITGPGTKYCARCANKRKLASQFRSKEIAYGAHKCANCERLIPIDKVLCGSKAHPKSCFYKQMILDKLLEPKKPKPKKKAAKRDKAYYASSYY